MSIQVIRGARRSGKTIYLIQLSCEKQIPILVASIYEVDALKRLARKLGYDNLPEPFSVHEVFAKNKLVGRREGILIDDVGRVFNKLLGNVDIHACTYTLTDDVEEIELMPEWLKTDTMLNNVVKGEW